MASRKTFNSFTSSRAARRRVWGFVFVLVVTALLSFNASSAQQPPEIDNALPCGRVGEVGDVAPGNALFRINVNLNNFPDAVCND
ncbi:MAG: hypothetical protein NZ823_07060, partial [Blastocatellia bacterium]|nr:hypothetical protein [Blastocatellia bacterium]